MTDQELIQWGREMRPNDDNLIEAGTPAETEASLVYLWDVVLAEGGAGLMQRGIGLNNEDGDEVAHVGLTQTRQEIHLTVSTVTDRAATQVTADLTPEECDELAGALKDVAAVARAYGEDFTVRAPGRGHILGWRS